MAGRAGLRQELLPPESSVGVFLDDYAQLLLGHLYLHHPQRTHQHQLTAAWIQRAILAVYGQLTHTPLKEVILQSIISH